MIARLLSDGAGSSAGQLTAVIALLLSLGTVNAFIATTSRLGYALARDGVFPAALAKVTPGGVPLTAVLAVGGCAGAGLVVTYLAHWGPETLLVVPNSLVIVTYIVGMAAGVRLLSGKQRLLALFAGLLCLVLVPFSGGVFVIPVVVALLALAYHRWLRGRPMQPQPPTRTVPALWRGTRRRQAPWRQTTGDTASPTAKLTRSTAAVPPAARDRPPPRNRSATDVPTRTLVGSSGVALSAWPEPPVFARL